MPDKEREGSSLGALLRNFMVEIAVYGALVLVYFVVVLRLLGDTLAHLFHNSLMAYAALALALIVGQGVLLESLTSFLLDQIKFDRLK